MLWLHFSNLRYFGFSTKKEKQKRYISSENSNKLQFFSKAAFSDKTPNDQVTCSGQKQCVTKHLQLPRGFKSHHQTTQIPQGWSTSLTIWQVKSGPIRISKSVPFGFSKAKALLQTFKAVYEYYSSIALPKHNSQSSAVTPPLLSLLCNRSTEFKMNQPLKWLTLSVKKQRGIIFWRLSESKRPTKFIVPGCCWC